ncbi:MAG: LysR family transcriptional regulator [Pseudomonadota bacterium]
MLNRPLATLVTIARTSSFQRAAHELNMTLSAVSMQMKTLEASLGVALFDRSTRPPQLTPLGREVELAARDVLAAEAKMTALVAEPGRLSGIYHIGFVPTASVRLAPGMLLHARAAHPEARFEMTTGLSDDLTRRVQAGELDAAVVTAKAEDRGQVIVAEEEIVWALPASHAETAIERCLEDLPFIQFIPATGIGSLIDAHLTDAGQAANEVIVIDSVEAVMECVRTGLGFTALPRPDVARYGGGHVASRSLSNPPLMRRLVLEQHPRLDAGDQGRELAKLLKSD